MENLDERRQNLVEKMNLMLDKYKYFVGKVTNKLKEK
jgi:hypothetical protein